MRDLLIIFGLVVLGVILLKALIKSYPRYNTDISKPPSKEKIKKSPPVQKPKNIQYRKPTRLLEPVSEFADLEELADSMKTLCRCECETLFDNGNLYYKPNCLVFVDLINWNSANFKCKKCGKIQRIRAPDGYKLGDGWIPSDLKI